MEIKRGEISTHTIIIFIILIFGFALVLLLYSKFAFTGTIDKETCHQSVILRATLPELANAKDYVPLKCKTDKICVTAGLIGGKCSEFNGVSGVTTVKVSNTLEVEQLIASNMVDCWSMMGEGKVSIFSQWFATTYGFGPVYPSCVVCNRIAFDKTNLDKAGIDLSAVDVMHYMQFHNIPNKNISYYDYMTGGVGKISVNENLFTSTVDNSYTVDADTQKVLNGLKGTTAQKSSRDIDFSKDSIGIIFTQVSAPSQGKAFANLAGAGLAILGVGFINKPGAFIRMGSAGTSILSKATGGVAATVLTKVIIAAAIIAGVTQQANVYWQRSVTAGYCGDVSVGSEARDGCSVVRAVDYDSQSINQYCSVVESIP